VGATYSQGSYPWRKKYCRSLIFSVIICGRA
jgi:hypothetical protein